MSEQTTMTVAAGEAGRRGPFDFAGLEPIVIRDIYIPDPEDPRVSREYVLREADAGTGINYKSTSASGIRMEDGKPVRIERAAEADAVLLAGCLFEVYQDKGTRKERPVIVLQVKKFANRFFTPLVEKAKEISRLNKDEKPEDLRKQIAALQKKLAAAESLEANGERLDGTEADGHPKGSPPPTPGHST